jgi:hypothetical protein
MNQWWPIDQAAEWQVNQQPPLLATAPLANESQYLTSGAMVSSFYAALPP